MAAGRNEYGHGFRGSKYRVGEYYQKSLLEYDYRGRSYWGQRRSARLAAKSATQSAWSTYKSTRKGFPNVGNSCFFNALVQALLCIETFVEYISAAPINTDAAVATGLFNIIAKQSYSSEGDDDLVRRAVACLYDELVAYGEKNDRKIIKYQQNDAHDVYLLIIDMLHVEQLDMRKHKVVFKRGALKISFK